MSVMIVGFVVVLGLLVVVVVNASGAYLQHRRLVSAADGAAMAAANGLDREAVYHDEIGERAPLSKDKARKAARRYVHRADIPVESLTVSVHNRRVRVRVSTSYRASLIPPGWRESSQVVAESTAELRVHE